MQGPGPGLYQKDLKSGALELLLKLDPAVNLVPSDWTRDGRFMTYTNIDPKTRADIWYAPIESGVPNLTAGVKVLGTEAMESQGQVSPDGKWLAYVSTETGIYQVYVRPFPTGAAVWKVSVENGLEPRWRADGTELHFLTRSGQAGHWVLMTSTVTTDGSGLHVATPQRLFEARLNAIVVQGNVWSYSPHPDGQRFLVNVTLEPGEPTISVITHWQRAAARPESR